MRNIIIVFYIFSLSFYFRYNVYGSNICINKSDSLNIIPYPKNLTLHDGIFRIQKDITIILSDENDKNDMFSAKQLIEEIYKDLRIKVSIGKASENPNILLTRTKISGSGDTAAGKKDFAPYMGAEGYLLKILPTKIIIAANEAKGVFYGVQTLKQIIRSNRKGNAIPCMDVIDWPSMQYRGWQDDISRGPIPKLDFLKEEIRIMSEYKQNLFTLYTEHVFKLKKHPKIAPDDGISEEEIKELSAYAKKHHVELIGNFQSFGHFANILKVPEYADLGEANWIISPGKEESYKFLSDVYNEIAPAYESPLFNINCDETDGIGSGSSKIMMDSIGIDGVYAYHINRLNSLLKPLGKTIMMWGDIAVHNKKIIPKLPKDLIILSWGYDARENFDDAILPFKETGFKFFVCPGVNCWGRLWPDFETAIINISNYIRDGAKNGAIGTLNTTWDDTGDNLFNYNWYPLIWGAECSWNPAIPQKNEDPNELRNSKLAKFNKSFDPIFFSYPGNSITNLLNKLSSLKNLKQMASFNEGKFRNRITLSPHLTLNNNEIDETEKVLKESKQIITDLIKNKNKIQLNGDKIDFALFAAKRIIFCMNRDMVQNEISLTIKNNKELSRNLVRKIKNLYNEIEYLKNEYTKLWNSENRPWWLDKNQKRYNDHMTDLEGIDLEVMIKPEKRITNGSRTILLSTLSGKGIIYYTLDGNDPGQNSIKYSGPFAISKPGLFKAAAFYNGRKSKITEKNLNLDLSFGKEVLLKELYNPRHSGGSPNALSDGDTGSTNPNDGKWQGYEGNDLEAVIDLEENIPIKKISASFLNLSAIWIFLPVKVEFEISDDGKEFKTVYSLTNEISAKDAGRFIKDFSIDLKDIKTRYIRVKAKNTGKCPEWHSGSGGKAWIFVDEIIIE